jgi:hypothetical protein
MNWKIKEKFLGRKHGGYLKEKTLLQNKLGHVQLIQMSPVMLTKIFVFCVYGQESRNGHNNNNACKIINDNETVPAKE